MDHAKPPLLMSARERTNEVAFILAAGLARLRLRIVNDQSCRGSGPLPSTKNYLDFCAEKSLSRSRAERGTEKR